MVSNEVDDGMSLILGGSTNPSVIAARIVAAARTLIHEWALDEIRSPQRIEFFCPDTGSKGWFSSTINSGKLVAMRKSTLIQVKAIADIILDVLGETVAVTKGDIEAVIQAREPAFRRRRFRLRL